MTVPDRLDAVEPFLKDLFEAGRYTIMSLCTTESLV